ncbi:MAG: ribosome biogenesis GTP-binding protein YihA/YsxC [Candidatus Kapaibacterium sp.]
MMKILEAVYLISTTSEAQFPISTLPEVAFIGRSNVGKSSLLNSIVSRKNLARISSTPGKTQQINFFGIEQKWVFADLPGFGYAVISKQKRNEWANFNYTYLEKRPQLALVCMLIDSRHDPMDSDLSLIEWLENQGRKYVIILTKTDKISPKLREERRKQLQSVVQYCDFCVDVLPYSSVSGEGRESLWGIIKREAVVS